MTAVALSNGGVAKTADAGDKATITYSEKIKASTFCSSWVDDGSTQTLSGVTLNFTNNGSSDALTIASAGLHVPPPAGGRRALYRRDHDHSRLDPRLDPTAMTLTITLGTPSGSASTNVAPSKPSYTPDGALTDWAGTRSRRPRSPRARTATSRAKLVYAHRRSSASRSPNAVSAVPVAASSARRTAGRRSSRPPRATATAYALSQTSVIVANRSPSASSAPKARRTAAAGS